MSRPGGAAARIVHRWLIAGALLFGALLAAQPSSAWILHEHTKIGRRAFEKLVVVAIPSEKGSAAATLPAAVTSATALSATSPGVRERAALEAAWKLMIGPRPVVVAPERRRPAMSQLCEQMALPSWSRVVTGPQACIDFGMLPALAADFSCSPGELIRTVDDVDWLPDLLDGARETEGQLLAADEPVDRIDEWHADHLRNFDSDPKYLERASGNLAHFLLVRTGDDLRSYVQKSLAAGQKPNAFAYYTLYHMAAVRLAYRSVLASTETEKRIAVTKSLFAEAFALHYLEDAFSAGHVVGTTGRTRERAGTHDFYCEQGVEARAWPPLRTEMPTVASYYAHGDAFLSDEDVEHASDAVRESLYDLGKILDTPPATATQQWGARGWYVTDPAMGFLESVGSASMDACKIEVVPARLMRSVPKLVLGQAPSTELAPDPWIEEEVLSRTFMPALGTHPRSTPMLGDEPAELVPSLPRAQADMGWFAGFFGSIRYGFGVLPEPVPGGEAARFLGTLEAGFDVGVSANGIATSSTDALFFAQFGVVAQSAELDTPVAGDARVPDRTGVTLRVRIPYLIVPGDGLLVAPFAVAGSRSARWYLLNAAERGPWGIGRTLNTSVGGFHVVLGRELGFRWVGHNRWEDFVSFGMDVPMFELRQRTWFAGRFGTNFTWQLGATADFGKESQSVGGYLRFAMPARYYPAWGQ